MPPESAPNAMPSRPSTDSRPQSLLSRWWRRQSPSRQDNFATLGPLLSVALFLAACISVFWYLRNEQVVGETESVKRDAELTQQQVGLRLGQNQEELTRLARAIVNREVNANGFLHQAGDFTRNRPEITQLSWLGTNRIAKASHSGLQPPADIRIDSTAQTLHSAERDTAAELAFRVARTTSLPAYSRAFANSIGAQMFQLHIPLIEQGNFTGALIAEYSVESLLRNVVPPEVIRRHVISVLDEQRRVLASTSTARPGDGAGPAYIVSDAPLTPALNGLVLRSQGRRTSIGLIGNTLFWIIVALSILCVWMMLGTLRHMRLRSQIQRALVLETNFRRAMENSMPTGMRAMDLEGRVTYVNAAFCQMTGFSAADLVGHLPPYPYWPPDRTDEYHRLLLQDLQGDSPSGGVELKLMRKDGSVFEARVYTSPLIDPKGQQTGWMISITDITAANRVRDQHSQGDSNSAWDSHSARHEDTGPGGYIFIDLRDDHKAMFHDVLKGFEEFGKLKGYSIAFSVDGCVPNKIAFKFTVLPSGTPVTAHAVQDDLKEYIRRVQSGDVDLSDIPRVVPLEQHEALLLAMRNRIVFLQHTYQAQRNVLDYYERVLRNVNPRGAGIAPAQTFYFQTGGDMSSRNYTAVGSNRVVQGEHNAVDQSVHIARSFNERKQQLENLDQLIAALAHAGTEDSTKKAVITLEKVKDELTTESTPDESRIKKWLDTAKDSIKALALGKEVLDLARKTFESFNIVF